MFWNVCQFSDESLFWGHAYICLLIKTNKAQQINANNIVQKMNSYIMSYSINLKWFSTLHEIGKFS